MKTKAKPRLKKGPDVQDYVVETIEASLTAIRTWTNYFYQRSEARKFAKEKSAEGFRVRTFRIKYFLIADSKRKVRK